MPFLSRTCFATVSVTTLTAAIAACGHLPFEAVPGEEKQRPGPSADGGHQEDAATDGSCTGPRCPGIYVSGEKGDDANSGTTGDDPVKTITKGIELAAALGEAANVFIAGARYVEKVTLADGVSLLGGYECNAEACSWSRDVGTIGSEVVAVDFVGTVVPPLVTRRTLVDGLVLRGKEGAPSAPPGAEARPSAAAASTAPIPGRGRRTRDVPSASPSYREPPTRVVRSSPATRSSRAAPPTSRSASCSGPERTRAGWSWPTSSRTPSGAVLRR
jgi:hypothetical protein